MEEGLYGFRVTANTETEVYVLSGMLEAAGEEGSVLVNAQEKITASNGFFPEEPAFMGSDYGDSFAQWNRSRDALIERRVNKAYLPPEMSDYEEELAYNGDWVYEYPYGYVWVPRVYHHTWRPYLNGRWVWYALCGWSWVPYEPWGWCVSHYGRWHWRFGLGWYWIPTSHWGPAWVHWYSGYNHIGWCPLSYYGYPVVVVNNRFYGRGYGHHYPLHSRSLTVVHRNQLQSPRISKVALSGRHVQQLGKISLSARQPHVRYSTRNSPGSAKAAKVLARSNIRKVERSFSDSSSFETSRRTKASSIRGKTTAPAKERTTRYPVSKRSLSPSVQRKSRSGDDVPFSRVDSDRDTRTTRSFQRKSSRTVRSYPSRKARGSDSRFPGMPRERTKSSSLERTRNPVKNYGSQRSRAENRPRDSTDYQFRRSRKETGRSAASRYSSSSRYPSRVSSSEYPRKPTYGGRPRSSSGNRQSYRYPLSYRSTAGYKSAHRIQSSTSRSLSRRSYSLPKNSFLGRYSSPKSSYRSRSYSKGRSVPKSSGSYFRGKVSSSKGSASRVRRSSSGSRRSSSSPRSRQKK